MNDPDIFSIRHLLFEGNQNPDNNAIECPGYEPLIYRDLRLQITDVVKTLNAAGFHRNDRIAVITPAGPETAVVIVSVTAGFTSVPLNPQYKEQEYDTYFSQLQIQAIIVQEGCETAARAAAESRSIPVIELIPVAGKAGRFFLAVPLLQELQDPEFATSSDIAYVLLTSGTTASSKTVPLTQKQSCLSKQKTCQVLHLSSADRCLHILPYYHGMGIGTALLSTLIAGGTVICTKDFIPSDFPELLIMCKPTHYSAGPALHQAILKKIRKIPKKDLAGNSLRFIRSTSGTLPAEVRRGLEQALGVPVIDSFGMSEAGTITINIPGKTGSVGIPLVDSLRIVDKNGVTVPTGSCGEIAIKGGTIFSGYEKAPGENSAAFLDGWFMTGDLGYTDEEGYLFITGRKKELINKGGEKISPLEVDRVLISHPLVLDAMSFPVDDPALGEDIAVMVVSADTRLTEEELRRFLLERLVQFKVPRRICFVDAIPRNPAGKPLRHVGTERYS
ncbi:MAG: AMP-binding protein [Methanoregula sp.]|jgi:acyl-CoA synthetase (AMP-forming)/AMP-acid ligase II